MNGIANGSKINISYTNLLSFHQSIGERDRFELIVQRVSAHQQLDHQGRDHQTYRALLIQL